MTWSVEFHPLVNDEDLPAVDAADCARIVRAIREKLGTAPEVFGRPLRGNLHGYWKLRIGDYRVIYKVCRDQVLVLIVKIGLRRNSEVYVQALRRLKRIR